MRDFISLPDIAEMSDAELEELGLTHEHRDGAREIIVQSAAAVNDTASVKLSLRAFGLYCFMATRGKTIPAETVSDHVKEGIGATKTAMRELRNAGLVHHTTAKFKDTGLFRSMVTFNRPEKWNQEVIGDFLTSFHEIYEQYIAKHVEDRW